MCHLRLSTQYVRSGRPATGRFEFSQDGTKMCVIDQYEVRVSDVGTDEELCRIVRQPQTCVVVYLTLDSLC